MEKNTIIGYRIIISQQFLVNFQIYFTIFFWKKNPLFLVPKKKKKKRKKNSSCLLSHDKTLPSKFQTHSIRLSGNKFWALSLLDKVIEKVWTGWDLIGSYYTWGFLVFETQHLLHMYMLQKQITTKNQLTPDLKKYTHTHAIKW